MRKYRNQIIIGLLLALGIYIILLLFLDNQGQLGNTEGVLEAIADFPIIAVIPVIFFQVLVIFFRFVEWHYYLGVIDARDKIRLLDSIVIFIAGFTMVVSPGKAAEVLKAVFLKVKTDVPVARSAPVVVAERVVDGMAVILILVLTLLFAGEYLNLGAYESISRGLIFSSGGLLVTGLIVVQFASLAYFVLGIIARVPFLKHFQSALVAFYESSREIFRLRHVIPMTFVGMGVYTSSAIGFTLILMAFGLEFSWQLFLQATFIVGVAAAIGALSFVPNGAGVTEISNTIMLIEIITPLHPLMMPAVAGAAALIQGFFHKWFRVLVGLLVAFVFRRRLFTNDVDDVLADLETEQQPSLKIENV